MTLLFLYYFSRTIPDSSFEKVRTAWRWTPVFLYLLFSVTSGVFRAFRYRLLLGPVRVRFIPLLLVTFVRNFTVDLLPMRLGSLTYPGLLRYRLHVSWAGAFSSYFWAIIWDFFSLGLFLVGASLLLVLHYTFAYPFLIVAFLFLLAWTLFMVFPDQGLRRAGYILYRFRRYPFVRRFRKLFPFQKNLRVLFLTGRLYPFTIRQSVLLLLSICIRGLKYGSLYVLYGFYTGIFEPSGNLMDLPLFIWTITGAEMTAALPIQGLMNIGPWETAWTTTLSFLELHSKEVSLVLSSFVHWTTQALEYTVGFIALGLLFGLEWQRPQDVSKTHS